MDIKTLQLALALGNLTLCVLLFFFDYEGGKPRALSLWLISKKCQAAAWFLLYCRGLIPDVLLVPFASALLFSGVALEAGALWDAADCPGWRAATGAAVALAVALFWACFLIDMDGAVRVATGSLIIGAFYLSAVAALALDWHRVTMLRRALAVVIAVLALAVVARAIVALALPNGWGAMTGALMQTLSSVALYLLMLASSFGYLLLAREQLQLELARLAVVDSLTDVPNRRGFFNALTPWMALARRPGLPTSLIVLDFDHFKRVNDSYGHPVGDAVLRSVVDVCKGQLRDSDQLGRLGGVEFAVLLPRTNLVDAAMVAERMRCAILDNPVKSERAVINLTASLGVTTIRPDDSMVSLFKRADEALQTAKLAGRNNVVEAQVAMVIDA